MADSSIYGPFARASNHARPDSNGFSKHTPGYSRFYDQASEVTNCSPSENPCDPDFPFALFESEHQPVRLEVAFSTLFFSDRRIYGAAIISGQIPGGTEPMWSRYFCTQLTIEHGRHFARLLSTAEHRLSQAQFSERDHARATRASFLAGNSPGPREAHPRALKLFSLSFFFLPCFCIFSNHVKIVPYVLHLHDHLEAQTTIHKKDPEIKQ